MLSLPEFTIKRCPHECKWVYQGLTARCKPLVAHENREARLESPRRWKRAFLFHFKHFCKANVKMPES